jgi:hypothetical protein
MHFYKILLVSLLLISCKDKVEQPVKTEIKKITKKIPKQTKKEFVLNDDNAIPFFFEYGKKNKENKVRIITSYGNIDIELFINTPYHRANFIYLTKNKYFEGNIFIEL